MFRTRAGASGGSLGHLVEPDDGLAERVRFPFHLRDPARPQVGTLVVPAFARLPAEFFSQRDALLQCAQGAGERSANVLVECKSHHVRAVGMTGMTAIMRQIII